MKNFENKVPGFKSHPKSFWVKPHKDSNLANSIFDEVEPKITIDNNQIVDVVILQVIVWNTERLLVELVKKEDF